jgi:hypothetical protein
MNDARSMATKIGTEQGATESHPLGDMTLRRLYMPVVDSLYNPSNAS